MPRPRSELLAVAIRHAPIVHDQDSGHFLQGLTDEAFGFEVGAIFARLWHDCNDKGSAGKHHRAGGRTHGMTTQISRPPRLVLSCSRAIANVYLKDVELGRMTQSVTCNVSIMTRAPLPPREGHGRLCLLPFVVGLSQGERWATGNSPASRRQRGVGLSPADILAFATRTIFTTA